MSLGNNRISDIIDEETEEEIYFIASMVMISPEELVRNAIQMHIDHRAGLPEFTQQVAREVEEAKEVGSRLARRHAKVMRAREAAQTEKP